jgi:hypothetical protein
MEPREIIVGDPQPDLSLPILQEDLALDLPSNAVLNPDGTVTVTFDYPAVLKFRQVGSEAIAREETIASLTLRRLSGVDVRKMIAAKNPTTMALALSSGLSLGKLSLLQQRMDARDEASANDVVDQMLGGLKMGLPDHATDTEDGVTLPLRVPAVAGDGTVFNELKFGRLTAAQRRQAAEAANILDWGMALATGMTPKQAQELVDGMDGADAMAVNMAVLFLLGSGRRTGR